MRVVVAPDKFKGCLTAAEVAAAVAAGIAQVRGDVEATLMPVADGGDGTVAAALSVGYQAIEVDSVGPTADPVRATYAVNEGRAVVELANVVGLDLLPGGVLAPLRSSTYGLGLVMRHAIDHGASDVVLGVGGSASTDGGAGMLQALGARLRDDRGNELPRGGGALTRLASLDLAGLVALVGETRFVVASDVDNPLLGERGATAVFGPQKGVTADLQEQVEAGLARFAAVVTEATGHDESARAGAGAAGGTGYAAVAVLGAQIRPGIEMMLELLGFADAIVGADLIITGEGSLDEQSLAGKAPIGVADAAAAAGVPVVAVAGRSLLSAERAAGAGIRRIYPLSDLEPDVAKSIANAGPLLVEVGARIAREWLL